MDTNRTDAHDEMPGRLGGAYGGRLRASDADREVAAEVLRRHYAEGRLDGQEFQERIDRCYAAKTLSELDGLFFDLPAAASREPKQERERERPRRTYRPSWRLAGIVPIIAALVLVAVLTGGHIFWLAWPLLFFVFGPFGRRCGWQRAGDRTP